MKTPQNRIGKLLGTLVIGGCLAGPAWLSAQQTDPRPPPPQPEREAPTKSPEAVRGERIRQRIQDLHAAGKHDEANQMAERVRQAMKKMGEAQKVERKPRIEAERRKDAPVGKEIPPRAKMLHLRQAAEHLQAAGYQEQAEKARHEVGRMEAEARRMEEPKHRPDSNAEIFGEMKKMRMEMEELRQQIRRMKAERAPEFRPPGERGVPNRPAPSGPAGGPPGAPHHPSPPPVERGR